MVTQEATHEAFPNGGESEIRPHVTCLECGREFWYDWQKMRRQSARPQPIYLAVPGPRRAA